MSLAEGALRSILHHQKRRAILYCKIEDTHNMWVGQENQSLCFLQKGFGTLVLEERVKNFEGGVTFKVDMLSQIDFGKASASQEPKQAVVTQLLSHTVFATLSHGCLP